MNSIMTWSDGIEDDESYIIVEFPNTVEMKTIIDRIEEKLCVAGLRDGFSITVNGSCFKGPQGINWNMRIELETQAQMDILREIMKGI